MTTHQFTLILEGRDFQEDSVIEALFEAECDDATVGRVGEVQYLDFDRRADTFPEAVFGAMAAIEEAVPGARVVHLEPDNLVTMAEIASRTGRTRESVRLLISGERGPGGFPTPATHFRSRHRMWRWPSVAIWFADALDEKPHLWDPALAEFVTAFNAGLDLRNHQSHLTATDRQRIQELVS